MEIKKTIIGVTMETKNQNVNNDYLTLEEAVKTHGVSIRIYMKMSDLGIYLRNRFGSYLTDEYEDEDIFFTLCYIDESRYKVSQGYKVTVKPIDDRLAPKHFYISDFNYLLKEGHAKLLVQV